LGTSRPLLLGNVRARVKALLDERLPVYRDVAELTVETDGRSAEEVASEVRDHVERLEAATEERQR
ncbi:MAG: shikimate kinase, partial [Nocardioidaceae bacterium]